MFVTANFLQLSAIIYCKGALYSVQLHHFVRAKYLLCRWAFDLFLNYLSLGIRIRYTRTRSRYFLPVWRFILYHSQHPEYFLECFLRGSPSLRCFKIDNFLLMIILRMVGWMRIQIFRLNAFFPRFRYSYEKMHEYEAIY